MFQKIHHINIHPEKPTLIWDGDCGFCKFWKTRWELKTENSIVFRTFQEAADNFQEIPLKEFKKASRLIDTEGNVFSGPDSAYRSLWYGGNKFWHHLYKKSSIFCDISDHTYNHIAKNRSFYFKATHLLFGKNPRNLKPYWLLYLFAVILIFFLL
ncbi:DCC1-like thiol-disulfide oxidoreductase family protein [Gramella sp. AN32]|uniref:Thiol-disulfide oxidoreductase DCC family protein n=1 Tax=Christiangramia antarctica TaxID=2058158 RepID=A0ABW5X4V7_9FLAO|nr:DCC1-like thiol-disulfide oxidoreductase family protein [Gramella sp. AN32]MCM4157132.1 thiol-disulfide oxidoreductase [Gramella sp. AN32]